MLPATAIVFVLQDGLLQVRQLAAADWEAKCGAAQAQLRDHREADACQAEASTAEVRIPPQTLRADAVYLFCQACRPRAICQLLWHPLLPDAPHH